MRGCAPSGACDGRDERGDERGVLPDEREYRPVVISVDVNVQKPAAALEDCAQCIDRLGVPAFRKVRHGFERQAHARTLGAVKAYYDARAPEYDDWWLGHGRFEERDRPGWDEDVAALGAAIAALPPARTLDVACGTGFLTRHLRGEVVGLDASDRMLALARERVPHARFVRGDALSLPFGDGTFERLFTSYFYCHLEEDERRRFLTEARRVARELVVVASVLGQADAPERWEERILNDGSHWSVFKRCFVGPELEAELDGRLIHHSRYFLIVRA
jgi:ubiquinone/menaquinone biosynthesis C-methylase UbiE